jgi:tRNA A37 threonylcarbamoyladenosine biosynthesis protein TsaE
MDKINKIEKLEFDKFRETVTNLLNRLDYKDVVNKDNIIIATKESPLSSEKYMFILFQQRLSGNNVNLQEIKDTVSNLQNDNLANVIFLVSQFNISNGFEQSISREISTIKLQFIGRDRLIKLIDDNYSDFWKHEDLMLIEYEKQFCQKNSEENELKKLKIFNDKYQKLLDIYIEPRISHFYENKATNTPVRKTVSIDELSSCNKPVLLSGEAGTGKTTLLKKIGQKLIEENVNIPTNKNVPVFLTVTEIYENNYKIAQLITQKVEKCFQSITLKDFQETYKTIVLIDSIDELDEEKQKSILLELNKLIESFNIRYIIGTRNSEKLLALSEKKNFEDYSIARFNTEQMRRFISQFFLGETQKAENLLDALRENRIIDKLPITPLTLSLISILYEEKNFEIPATIADIYDNFNSLIIGRSTVASRIEFIDISFKERILSLYALELLKKSQHTPMSKDEFFVFFTKYFEGKTLPIRQGTLEEVLTYLIDNTGVLILKDNKWVQFSHDSYMEYYGALEIFKHQREEEKLLVENFFENNWQNAAVFYAGKSKDMPKFLEKIIDVLKSAKYINQYFSGVLGCGYLLQALYQTDNKLRKNAVIEALNLNSFANDTLVKLASDEVVPFFKNYNLPILQLMGLMYFYETFNSITIKEPLKLAFEDIFNNYKQSKNYSDGYKAIELALTLDSKRINESSALETLVENETVLKDSLLYTLLDFSFGCFGTDKYKKIKDDIRKNYYPKLKDTIKDIISLPAHKLRFTNLETRTYSKIKIIVEGKTDAEILEHAFFVLTGGTLPYWNVIPAGNFDSGGASEVAKVISNCKPLIEKDELAIGLFDHDAKGLQEFRGLKENIFTKCENNTFRKHKDCDIYALLLPVPGELEHYLQKDQQFNYFEIEHYFKLDMLLEKGIAEKTVIEGGNIYKIKDGKKKDFSKYIRTQDNPQIFTHFVELFEMIDKITNSKVEYIE